MVHTQIFLAFQQTTTTRAQSWKSRRASGDIAIRLSRVSLRPYFSQKFFQPSFHSHPPCYISYARNASPFIKIPLKLSPLLLFLETKRSLLPPGLIKFEKKKKEGEKRRKKTARESFLPFSLWNELFINRRYPRARTRLATPSGIPGPSKGWIRKGDKGTSA